MRLALIGQAQAETLLARSIAGGRVGHAYLFLGAAGAGKATAARLFAQAVNCERQPAARKTERGGWALDPCGACESCRRIAAGTHPEVLEVLPDSKTGQNISIDQAREIRRNAALRPKLGQRRIYLIPNAEAFSEPSANALLKTLEEPSDFVMLVLCAPNPSQVLPTIRSRCQTVRFGLARPAEVAAALVQRGTAPETAAALARACGGRPGLAFSWAGDPAVLQQRQKVLSLFAQAVAAQAEAARTPRVAATSLRLAEQLRLLVGREKEDDAPARPAKARHSDNLETGLTYLRDLLLLAQDGDQGLAQNQDRLEELQTLAAPADVRRVADDVAAVREAQQMLERNVTPQLVLERMFWTLIAGPVPGSTLS
jgi:DNA polymerase-3 subunit delta'